MLLSIRRSKTTSKIIVGIRAGLFENQQNSASGSEANSFKNILLIMGPLKLINKLIFHRCKFVFHLLQL